MLILLISSMLLSCCLEKDDVLPNAMPYTGNQLKTGGYYYQIASNNGIYNPLVMYNNGILLTLGGAESTLEKMDEYVRKNYIRDSWYKKNKYVWGIFFIEDDAIRINELSQDYPHRGIVQEGVILNDTTFKITKFSSGGKVKERDEIYHFREFSPKPDSTNVYIK